MPTAIDPQQTLTTTITNTVPFPSSQTFDILPEIYALLSRLQVPASSSASASTGATTSIDSLGQALGPALEIKDLHQAALFVKLKIQKAKAAVAALPDVDRTVAEQEVEINGLEEKIRRLKSRIEGLGRRAADSYEPVDPR